MARKNDTQEVVQESLNGSSAPQSELHHSNERGTGVRIAPSLLAADPVDLKTSLLAMRSANLRWLHIDVMDGHFVPNHTFGPATVASIRKHFPDFYLDVHLMIEEPQRFVKTYLDAGANLITFHVEAAGDESLRLLKQIRRARRHAGISIKPGTPVSAIEPLLSSVDLVLVMTVEPGFGGQKLIARTLAKVRALHSLRDKLQQSFIIQVDGGINLETAPLAVAAGADVLAAGSSVFGEGKLRDNVKRLKATFAKYR